MHGKFKAPTVNQLVTAPEQTTGFVIEPNKRYAEGVRGQHGRRIIKKHTICNQCMSSIVRKSKMAESLVVFNCNH